MVFNSYLYILIFLPMVVTGYYLCNRISLSAGKIFLLAASLFFYVYAARAMTWVLICSMVVNYLLSRPLNSLHSSGLRKAIFLLGISLNAAVLLFFKYANFVIQTFGGGMHVDLPLVSAVLPLGISFYTFQQISWLSAMYRGEVHSVHILDYALYIMLFPKLLMGPLAEPKELLPQFNDPDRKHPNGELMMRGVQMFVLGLGKKVLLADLLMPCITWGLEHVKEATSAEMLLLFVCAGFHLYFDFSGYSDMAIGTAAMLNLDLPINFDSPYRACSFRQYWRSWHMTLTRFLTRHLYIPMGGNRRGTARMYINIMTVFLVSGLWHGANWTFVLWGGLHGLLYLVDRATEKHQEKIPAWIRWLATFSTVFVLNALIYTNSVGEWLAMLYKAFSFHDMHITPAVLSAFNLPEISFMNLLFRMGLSESAERILGLCTVLGSCSFLCLFCTNTARRLYKPSARSLILLPVLLLLCLVNLSAESVFVYLGF